MNVFLRWFEWRYMVILLVSVCLPLMSISLQQVHGTSSSSIPIVGEATYGTLTGSWTLHLIPTYKVHHHGSSMVSPHPCIVSVTFSENNEHIAETNPFTGVSTQFTIPVRERGNHPDHDSDSCNAFSGHYVLSLHELGGNEADEPTMSTTTSTHHHVERRLLQIQVHFRPLIDVEGTTSSPTSTSLIRVLLHTEIHRALTNPSKDNIVSMVGNGIRQAHQASFVLANPRLWFLALELADEAEGSTVVPITDPSASSTSPTTLSAFHTLHFLAQKDPSEASIPVPDLAWYQQTPFLMVVVVVMTVMRGYFAYRRESERMARQAHATISVNNNSGGVHQLKKGNISQQGKKKKN